MQVMLTQEKMKPALCFLIVPLFPLLSALPACLTILKT